MLPSSVSIRFLCIIRFFERFIHRNIPVIYFLSYAPTLASAETTPIVYVLNFSDTLRITPRTAICLSSFKVREYINVLLRLLNRSRPVNFISTRKGEDGLALNHRRIVNGYLCSKIETQAGNILKMTETG